MILKNKHILITGGTSGIGYELVEILYPYNRLIIVARDEEKLKTLSAQHQGIDTVLADLSKREDVETAADFIAKRYETIDVLINNAAVQSTPTFLDEDFQYESITREINVNFTSICSLTYLLLPVLLHERQAVVLNVNSGLALSPKTASAVYCATKGALNIFTQSLRYQLEDTNISVQQVFLGLVETAMTQGRGRDKMSAREAALKIVDGIQRNVQDHYMGKVKLLRMLVRFMPSLASRIMKYN